MEKQKEELIEWARKIAESGKAVIAEGKKDRMALESLGISNIFTLNKPLYAVVEEVSEKTDEAIILTDFDSKGRELYGKLKRDLQKNGVKIDGYFREFLQKNTRLSHIEGLKTYLRGLE